MNTILLLTVPSPMMVEAVTSTVYGIKGSERFKTQLDHSHVELDTINSPKSFTLIKRVAKGVRLISLR